jgi:hypothetical protein
MRTFTIADLELARAAVIVNVLLLVLVLVRLGHCVVFVNPLVESPVKGRGLHLRLCYIVLLKVGGGGQFIKRIKRRVRS